MWLHNSVAGASGPARYVARILADAFVKVICKSARAESGPTDPKRRSCRKYPGKPNTCWDAQTNKQTNKAPKRGTRSFVIQSRPSGGYVSTAKNVPSCSQGLCLAYVCFGGVGTASVGCHAMPSRGEASHQRRTIRDARPGALSCSSASIARACVLAFGSDTGSPTATGLARLSMRASELVAPASIGDSDGSAPPIRRGSAATAEPQLGACARAALLAGECAARARASKGSACTCAALSDCTRAGLAESSRVESGREGRAVDDGVEYSLVSDYRGQSSSRAGHAKGGTGRAGQGSRGRCVCEYP